MEQSQTQYQGPERRQSQSQYAGEERRRLDWPFPRMSTQERKEEQAERAREQQKEQSDRL